MSLFSQIEAAERKRKTNEQEKEGKKQAKTEQKERPGVELVADIIIIA